MNAGRSVWGLTCLLIPARLVTRRTTLAAPCRSSRLPSTVTNRGPRRAHRWPGRSRGQYAARAGWSPPCRLAGDDQGAMAALLAQVLDVRAGGLRYPQPVERKEGGSVRARRAGRALRRPGARQARCGPGRWRATRNPAGDGGRARRASARGALLRRRTCKTRRWCTAAG
jgi:hypothetical protein